MKMKLIKLLKMLINLLKINIKTHYLIIKSNKKIVILKTRMICIF